MDCLSQRTVCSARQPILALACSSRHHPAHRGCVTRLSEANERMLAELGVGITNFVSRPSARADELTGDELQEGGLRLVQRVNVLQPNAVAIVGITAFRTAFSLPKAKLGRQNAADISGWPQAVQLWGLPNPSGLNAHETTESRAAKWRAVWEASKSR